MTKVIVPSGMEGLPDPLAGTIPRWAAIGTSQFRNKFTCHGLIDKLSSIKSGSTDFIIDGYKVVKRHLEQGKRWEQ